VVLPFSISKVHFPRSTIKMSLILRSVLHLSFLPLYSVGLLLVPYISIWPLGEIIMIIFPESTPILSPFFEDLKWTLRVFAYFAAAYTVAEVWFQVWEKPDTHRRGVLHIFEWPQSVSNPPSNRTTICAWVLSQIFKCVDSSLSVSLTLTRISRKTTKHQGRL
jgi:hypothetical protein